MVSAPQPQPRLRRLHRLSDRSKELARQRIEIDLIAHLPGEPVECPLRVVPGPALPKGWRSRKAIPPTSNATARRGRIPRPQRPGGGARSSQRHSLTGWPSGERYGIPHRMCSATLGGHVLRGATPPHQRGRPAAGDAVARPWRRTIRESAPTAPFAWSHVTASGSTPASRASFQILRRCERDAWRSNSSVPIVAIAAQYDTSRIAFRNPYFSTNRLSALSMVILSRSTSGIPCENDGLALVRYPSGRCIERSPFDGSTVTSPQCPTTGHRPPPTLSRRTRVNSSHTPSGLAGNRRELPDRD